MLKILLGNGIHISGDIVGMQLLIFERRNIYSSFLLKLYLMTWNELGKLLINGN